MWIKQSLFDKIQVLLDFAQHFSDIDSNAFLDTWSAFGEKLKEVHQQSYNSNIDTEWSDDVENFLILLKLLPKSPGRKGLATRVSFQNTIRKLIVFSKVKNNNLVYL